MTCIVGLIHEGYIYLGGDSAAASAWDILETAQPKVFRLGDMVMGYTTSFRMGQLLQYVFKVPEHPNGMDDYAYMVSVFAEAIRQLFNDGGFAWVENQRESGGEFIIGYRGKLYVLQSDFAVLEYVTPYISVGCGSSYAMGAMYANAELPPKKRVKLALKAAEKFSNGVVGPFTVLKL